MNYSSATLHPLLADRLIAWFSKKIREYHIPLICSFLVGILAHMFAFTNKLVNGDDVFTLFFKGGSYTLGRWGLVLFDNIFPNYSMPWVYGIITIALIAVSVCILIHVFHIQNKLLQGLLAGLIVAFPSLTGVFSFMFMSCTYSSAFLLTVLSVYLMNKSPVRYLLPAGICLILSLSLYQGYIALAASLLVLVLIQQLLENTETKAVFRRGIFFLIFLVLSLGIYYMFTQLLLRITGYELNSYANARLSFEPLSLPSRVLEAYHSFFKLFDEAYNGLIPTVLSRRVHYLCVAAAGILFLLWLVFQKAKKAGQIFLLLALIAILPLTINCMYLFATVEAVHTLVLYSFVSVYMFAAVLAEASMPLVLNSRAAALSRRIALEVVTIGMALVIVVNIYIANEAYLCMYLQYENTYAFYSSVIAELKATPEFNETTTLAVIGDYQRPDFYQTKFDFAYKIFDTTGYHPNSYAQERFLEYFIGLPIPCATDEDIAEITQSQEYQNMPTYPYYGSMKMIGNFFVVKLS